MKLTHVVENQARHRKRAPDALSLHHRATPFSLKRIYPQNTMLLTQMAQLAHHFAVQIISEFWQILALASHHLAHLLLCPCPH